MSSISSSDKHSQVFQRLIHSTAKAIVVNGCAGSRKTDTAVKFALHCMEQKKNVMMLTKVTSVTHETTTRLSAYGGIKFKKSGNHYFADLIEVANMDAAIHYQLCHMQVDISGFRGGSHNWKCQELSRLMCSTSVTDKRFFSKNKKPVDILVVDEFQDFDADTYSLIFNIVKQNSEMRLVVLGDIMQTIFTLSNVHPMNAIRQQFPDEYDFIMVNTCYRCPRSHIKFVNALHSDHLKKYGLDELNSANEDDSNPPILFAHQGISKNLGAIAAANAIVNCVGKLLCMDKDIQPKDIAIIMKAANNNKVYAQLEQMLNDLYRGLGYCDSVKSKVFETKGDLAHIAIDWNSAKNNTVMLSIHGDKGKGHKAVFFLGFTEKSIPRENNLYKDAELLEQSLSYVALTRSLKYLFVGFAWLCPSRYLLEAWDKITSGNLAVLAWQPSTYRCEKHRVLCEALQFCDSTPVFDFSSDLYKKEPIFCPDRLICDISDLVMNAFEEHHDVIPDWENLCTEHTKTFGKYATPPKRIVDNETFRCIYGVMAEMCIYREYCRQNNLFHQVKQDFWHHFLDSETVYYTSNEEELCFAYDMQLNYRLISSYEWQDEIMKTFYDVKLSDNIKALIEKQKVSPKFILPASLKVPTFLYSIDAFLDSSKPTSEIPTNALWNVAVGKTIINSQIRKPNLSLLLDMMHDSLTGLHDNINALLKLLNNQDKESKNGVLPPFTFANRRCIMIEECDPVKLKKMGVKENKHSVHMGITGIDDFAGIDCVYEIKAPISKSELSTRWVMQGLLYASIGDPFKKIAYNRFAVIDITRGVLYSFLFKKGLPREIVLEKYMQWMQFDSDQINAMLAKIFPSTQKNLHK